VPFGYFFGSEVGIGVGVGVGVGVEVDVDVDVVVIVFLCYGCTKVANICVKGHD
jgi:hypothetical protein